MDGGLRQELCEEHRLALFEVVEDLLKTDNFKVRIEPGSKKGISISLKRFQTTERCINFSLHFRRQFYWHRLPHYIQHRR